MQLSMKIARSSVTAVSGQLVLEAIGKATAAKLV